MSARTEGGPVAVAGCLSMLVVGYLILGCGIYLVAYGEPSGFSLKLTVVAVLWPVALIWWSLKWIAVAVAVVLMGLGVKHVWDGL